MADRPAPPEPAGSSASGGDPVATGSPATGSDPSATGSPNTGSDPSATGSPATGGDPSATGSPARPQTVAAVDLGSNSFHMVIARLIGGELHLLDRLKEPVRLGDGLDGQNRLSEEAQDRALHCLERFGQRLGERPRENVRAVGTNTLRRMKNGRRFRALAEQALGYPVEVISGAEEARLIFLGVSHTHPDTASRKLVVDIGGGSTEIIVGDGFEVLLAHSLHMGCVSFTRQFFPDGTLSRQAFRDAEIAGRLEMQAGQRGFRALGWDLAVGASGTITAIQEIFRAAGWSSGEISLPRLKKLRKLLVNAEHIDAVSIPELKPERAGVLPAGLAILIAIFESLEVETMTTSTGALREGVLYDLQGRIRHEDVRDRTIRHLMEQYHVDQEQAARVERTALVVLERVAAAWGLDDPASAKFLQWAARLHEMGLTVSYSSYQKHGAYIAANADMPGFSRDDQRLLSALIFGHRRKLNKWSLLEIPEEHEETALRLCAVLRLAVLLNRSRSPRPVAPPPLTAKGNSLTLHFPLGWLEEHPLTREDLAQEKAYLGAVNLELRIREGELS